VAEELSLGTRLRARLRSTGRPLVRRLARSVGYEVYEASTEHDARLGEHTELLVDRRPIRDHRPETTFGGMKRDLTVTTEGLEDMLGDGFRGARILEIGPKYGFHSRWLDSAFAPSELVFCDLPTEQQLHEEWRHEVKAPHRFLYGDLREARVSALGPFDLVLCLGVLYHTVYQVPMLAELNRATALGGRMLLETTIDPRPDASVWLRWHPRTGKAKGVPTLAAVRMLLAWTGWCKARQFVDYRPGSTEVVLLCEKTHELVPGSDFAPLVSPHRASRVPVPRLPALV
jgi:SAM-dependent methyltransferase